MAERSDEVKLLGMWASPFSRRIEIALTLKGVPYEFSEQDITNKSPLLLQSNPVHKMIPVLLHNGKPISESLVILEYIDDTWRNNPILPQDPIERATARFLAKFIDEQICVSAMKVVGKIGEERDAVVEATRDLLKSLEKELVGKDFFGAKSLGFVDIVATLIAFWLMRTEELLGVKVVPVEKFPEIHRWVKNLSELDVIKKCIPPEDEHLNYIKARMDSLNIKSIVNRCLSHWRSQRMEERFLLRRQENCLNVSEKELAGNDYLGGKTVGFLDLVAGSMISFCLERAWEGMGVEVITEEMFPEYNKWVKKLNEVEIVVDCIPPREKHIQHMNNMGAKIRSV